MPARDVLHDVPLDLLVLEHRHPVVDQDGRLGRLEVGPGRDRNVKIQPTFDECPHLRNKTSKTDTVIRKF